MPKIAETAKPLGADLKKAAYTTVRLPDVIEYFSVASHVGKSLFTDYTAALIRRQLDLEVVIVRIESKGARSRDADIHISAEDFAASARLPGGEVALLKPVFDHLESVARKDKRPVTVIDWGGGLAEYRAKIWASTRLDARLADFNMQGLSIVTTTSLVDRMRHARDLIEQTRLITPGLRIALLLNRRAGNFTFIEHSEEGRAFRDLQKAAEGVTTIRVQSLTGETWQTCAAANLSMSDVIDADLPTLQHCLGGESSFVASAFQMQVAAWWNATEREFIKMLGTDDAATR
jgi:hypothetical protein